MDNQDETRGVAVPTGRLNRFGKLGGTVAGIAGRAALQGATDVLRGRKPQLDHLLLTPANAARITHQLSQMRGAAMKLGQLMSMEADDMLPPELAAILARLRSDAYFVPPAQLKQVLTANWGPDFLKRFKRFDVRPIAAASIGQVHRAQTRDGRDVAIKVQYPGVRDSIDSDVRNLGLLLKTPGLLPRGLDLGPMMTSAATELHAEADYQREAGYLRRFRALLDTDHGFVVPQVQDDLTTSDILGMDYIESVPIDAVADLKQGVRDDVTTRLISLLLREIFTLGVMQTDPNFANYRYQPDTGRIVLLDFGAARDFGPEMATMYRRLLTAGLAKDREWAGAALREIGFMDGNTKPYHRDLMLDIFDMAMTPLRAGGLYDFSIDRLAHDVREAGMAFAEDRNFTTVPPIEALLLQRKIGGMYLLAKRLKARVDLSEVLRPFV